MPKAEQLTLVFEGTFDAPQKSANPNVLENVCLLGPVSRNGYKYSLFTAENASLYENAAVYFDHGRGADGRSIRDWAGTLRDVKACPGEQRFRGNLVFLDSVKDNPDVMKVREAAEKGLKNCGMSHVVSIDETKHKRVTKEGTTITGLKKVHSVDIVMNPATTNITESENVMSTPTTKTAKDILLSICRFDRETAIVESLGDVTTVEVAGLKADASVTEQVDACFDAMGAKVWNDDAKRADVLKAKKTLVEGVVETKEAKLDKVEPKPGEMLTYQEAHKLCDEQKVTSSATLLEAITGLSPIKAKIILEQLATSAKEVVRLATQNETYAKAYGPKVPGKTVGQSINVPEQPGADRPTGNTKEDAQKRKQLREQELASKN